MKRRLNILSALCAILCGLCVDLNCLAQLTDNFSDGELNNNPAWSGDLPKFIVNAGKLKLQAPVAAETAFLSTSSLAIHDAAWELYLQLDFTPSSTNYAKVYLVSDQLNLNGALNGYFIKAGNSSHEISLYRQNGSNETKIIDGLDERINLAIVKVRIRITRSTTGGWQLFSDVGPSGTYVLEGSITDNTHTTTSHFGVHCTYTSTRSDRFWFDDFIVTGTAVPDTAAPTIQNVTTVSQQQVRLLFSESLEPSIALNPINFFLNNIGAPASAALLADQRTVRLDFSSLLTNGVSYSLQVSGVQDLAGNAMSPVSVSVLFFQEVPVSYKEIIFTEVFPDPGPQIGLPDIEFVEIYNRSQHPFNLSGWKLTDGSSTGIFPSKIVLPGEYWIVTAASYTSLFTGKTIGLSNFPTLNNGGDVLILRNSNGINVDSVKYDIDWYRDVDKQEGGWTLEVIDPNNPCGEQDNWAASEDPSGGTPGKQNSIFANKPDRTPPKLLTVFPEDSTSIALSFDEKLDGESLQNGNFLLVSGTIFKASFRDISQTSIELALLSPMLLRELYTLEVKDILDCSLNIMPAASFSFGLAEGSDSLDVVVNEILFNPRSGGVDFVEVYNASPKFLNLKDWKLGNYINGLPVNTVTMFESNVLLPPERFAVFTTDPGVVELQYPSSHLQNLFKTAMPSLPDDEGSVVILDGTGKIVDEFSYYKDYHSQFIKDEEGVSLERIDIRAPANDQNSWTSASSTAGFATPGFLNSQWRKGSEAGEGSVVIEPEVFLPGGAAEDFIQIQYHFELGSWVANVRVYDQHGRLLKTIAMNETLGTQGFFRWDGDLDDGSKARMGYYFVWFEIFDSVGSIKTFRRRIIVSSRY